MRRLITIILLLTTLLVSTGFIAISPQNSAKAYVLMDFKSGRILCSYNENKKMYPASTTKIMTAVIALEKGDLNAEMTASQEAVDDIGKDGMNIGIMKDEKMRLGDLLNALLIVSANETANIIAENICKSRDEFVSLMNEKAIELGATHTHFENPCGKHDQNHYTTAADLALIARYAMTIPSFRGIVNKEYLDSLPATNKHDNWPPLRTTNKLLWDNREYAYISYGTERKFTVGGIKTGYTDQAGFNLATSAKNTEGLELISVIMGVSGYDSGKGIFTYSKDLLKYGFENFKDYKLSDSGQTATTINVADAADNAGLDLLISDEIHAVLPLNKSKWKLEKKVYINQEISAPINKGDVLGYVEYYSEGKLLGKTNLKASRTVELRTMKKITAGISKTVAKHPVLAGIIKYLSIICAVFLILRISLKKVSKIVKIRKRRRRRSLSQQQP